jgi:hypothetical protein
MVAVAVIFWICVWWKWRTLSQGRDVFDSARNTRRDVTVPLWKYHVYPISYHRFVKRRYEERIPPIRRKLSCSARHVTACHRYQSAIPILLPHEEHI